MASKQYISIIRLFDHCDISSGDDFNLSRAKKQLQAEFGIAQSGFIEVDGYTYTRHDVFEEIEQPDFLKRLIFHKQIWKSPQILWLLENNNADPIEINTEFKPLWGNKEFDEFFSPYFVGPFNYLSRAFLSEGRLREMGNLLSYEDFLQPAEREEAFRPIRVFLDESIRVLRNIHKENYHIMRPQINHWIDSDWYLFFNNLPHEFYETKNDITTYLINIGVAIQKTYASDCIQISEQLVSLKDTPESLRSLIVSNHTVYTGSSSSQGSTNWRIVFGAIWVIFMIMRCANSSGCNSSSTDYKLYLPPPSIKYQLPDSLSKILNLNLKTDQDSLLKFKFDSLVK